MAELNKTLKDGERILGPTRRPDGTLRRPIRIRAGYVPQDEVAIYQSKGASLKKEMTPQVPPGYDPAIDTKPKTKSAKRNERKKEKRQQVLVENGNNSETVAVGEARNEESVCAEDLGQESKSVNSLVSEMNELVVSTNHAAVAPPFESTEDIQGDRIQDIDKRIRALKKKIRLTEAQKQKIKEQDMKSEQLDKLTKLEDWQKELKLLENKKAELAAS